MVEVHDEARGVLGEVQDPVPSGEVDPEQSARLHVAPGNRHAIAVAPQRLFEPGRGLGLDQPLRDERQVHHEQPIGHSRVPGDFDQRGRRADAHGPPRRANERHEGRSARDRLPDAAPVGPAHVQVARGHGETAIVHRREPQFLDLLGEGGIGRPHLGIAGDVERPDEVEVLLQLAGIHFGREVEAEEDVDGDVAESRGDQGAHVHRSHLEWRLRVAREEDLGVRGGGAADHQQPCHDDQQPRHEERAYDRPLDLERQGRAHGSV